MGDAVKISKSRIVVNTVALLGPLAGIGQYVRQLARRLPVLDAGGEYTYFSGFFTKTLLDSDHRIYRIRDRLGRVPLLKKAVRETLFLFSRLRQSAFDLYFEPNFIPLNIKARKVVTTVHDFSFKLYPEAHPRERIEYFAKRFERNIRRCDRIITGSRYIKAEAAEFLNVPPELITPVHLGVDRGVFGPRPKESLEDCRRTLGLPREFILFVGTRQPRKNLDRLLRSYLVLPESMKADLKVVLVGPRGWGESVAVDTQRKIRDRVLVLDYVDGDTLTCIYNLASVFVFPSLYEGFGLPPLEAMACGCPVVVSQAASMPEVCGDAGYYVDPNDVSSIAGGIYKVLNDSELRRGLVARGFERVQRFSWEKTAKETLEVFSQVLGNG